MGNVTVLDLQHLLTASIAVLHPGLKLEYFRQHEWDNEWIDMAEDLVREEYAVNYQKKENIPRNGNAGEHHNQVMYNY